MSVSSRPLSQDEEADEMYFLNIWQKSSHCSHRDFNVPGWKYRAAMGKQSRRFLDCVEEIFLMKLVSEATRKVLCGPVVSEK